MKIISAQRLLIGTMSVSRKNMKKGTRITLATVSLFGRFIYNISNQIVVHNVGDMHVYEYSGNKAAVL